MKWAAGIGAVALVAGAALAYHPAIALLLIPVLGVPLLVKSAKARLLYTVGGGMLVLGSPSIDTPKLAYLAGLAVVLAVSLGHINSLLRAKWFEPFRAVFGTGLLLALMLAASFVVAHDHHTSGAVWLRDALTFILLITAPVIAFSCAKDLTPQWCARVVVAVGVIAAVGFATDWLTRRGVSGLPIGRFVLSSGALIALGFCYALVRFMLGPRRLRWLPLTALMPGAVLITGSRTALVMLAAFPAVLGRRAHRRVPLSVAIGTAALLAAALWVLIPVVGSYIITDPGFLSTRIGAVERILTSSADADQSYSIRIRQTARAIAVFNEYPILGGGLGYQFPVDVSATGGASIIDSPMGLVAKLGLLGTGALLLFLGAIVRAVVIVARRGSADPFFTAFGGFVAIFLLQIPFGSFVEDKGFSFSILLALATAAAFARSRSGDDSKLPVVVRAAAAR